MMCGPSQGRPPSIGYCCITTRRLFIIISLWRDLPSRHFAEILKDCIAHIQYDKTNKDSATNKNKLEKIKQHQTRCRPNGTKRYWHAIECYRRRQTTTDAREHHLSGPYTFVGGTVTNY